MSKEFPQFSEDAADKPEGLAKPKRPGATRAKKAASASQAKKSEAPKVKPAVVVKAPVAEAKVSVVRKEATPTNEPDWAEAAPEMVGGATQGGEGGNKRKRRRRKGNKGGGGASSLATAGEAADVAVVEVPAVPAPQSVKTRLDPESLAKAAWKIYLAEVSEEGVALVGDQDARELARRCFRLAEIFLEEQGRRRGGGL
jgi:hypothetical protein